jgi:hypothetical protein
MEINVLCVETNGSNDRQDQGLLHKSLRWLHGEDKN